MRIFLAILALSITLMASNSATIYQKCAACHGVNAEKPALGKSAIIAGWDSTKTAQALQEYKSGTRNIYGMGALMKSHMASLSDSDITNLAEYISTLK